jgi:hypothetical protein
MRTSCFSPETDLRVTSACCQVRGACPSQRGGPAVLLTTVTRQPLPSWLLYCLLLNACTQPSWIAFPCPKRDSKLRLQFGPATVGALRLQKNAWDLVMLLLGAIGSRSPRENRFTHTDLAFSCQSLWAQPPVFRAPSQLHLRAHPLQRTLLRKPPLCDLRARVATRVP